MRVVGVVACQFVVENVESEVRREAVTDVFHTQTGDVVDVRYILGETDEPCKSDANWRF